MRKVITKAASGYAGRSRTLHFIPMQIILKFLQHRLHDDVSATSILGNQCRQQRESILKPIKLNAAAILIALFFVSAPQSMLADGLKVISDGTCTPLETRGRPAGYREIADTDNFRGSPYRPLTRLFYRSEGENLHIIVRLFGALLPLNCNSAIIVEGIGSPVKISATPSNDHLWAASLSGAPLSALKEAKVNCKRTKNSEEFLGEFRSGLIGPAGTGLFPDKYFGNCEIYALKTAIEFSVRGANGEIVLRSIGGRFFEREAK